MLSPQILAKIRPSNFCWNELFTPSWKNGFQVLLQLNLTVFLPLPSQLLQLTWKLLCLQPTENNWPHEYYDSCSVQDRKGTLNPLQKHPVSQYCNFHMASGWISVKGTFSTTFCGTVQVGLVKAPLPFSGFNIASKQHGRSEGEKAFRKTFHYDNFLPLFSVPLYYP